ncbi:long-chain-fatty-acid-CoA ligase [Pleurotus eryngii]|uniref:Long-chain-fatty-acid-CoA ligase n=1 Tax=Pleurotus eryngii TaxID=5323 RepID=A0A9P6AAG6_PLEER|nr:long-chain-fatty-acid-CoA ligase [Pleurotus eryngii]
MFFSKSVNPNTTPWPEHMPYDAQAVEVPGTKRPGQTAHYRNGVFGLINENSPGAILTLPEVFACGISMGKDRPYLGHRPLVSSNPLKFADHYVWQTYAEVDVRRRRLGSALRYLFDTGVLGGADLDTVGIWSINRPEWQIVDLSLHAYRLVGVSLYDTLGRDAVEYITNHAQCTVVFTPFSHVSDLLKMAPQLPNVKLIVSLDNLTPEARQVVSSWGDAVGIQVKDLSDMEKLGEAHLTDILKPDPNSIASICYTSGTTSNPKGALLSHRCLAMSVFSNLFGLTIKEDGCALSYLPLAHIYERLVELSTTAVGGKVGYFTGDPLRLLEDAQVLKPNFFPAVPRVLNRVSQAAAVAGKAPGLKGALFRKAVQVKLDRLLKTGISTHPFWDRLVFSKVTAVLGGNLELIITGSAPTSVEEMNFLRILLCCEMNEGYGMTENAATCSKTWPNDPRSSGTVGAPHPINEVKLVDVPEMAYMSSDQPNPRGEICTRGLNSFSGYYKDEKNTKETLDSEGWLHTGDVGEIDYAGRLKIIDRVKNIMKLSQGEYVALEKIENLYGNSPLVQQIYVHGDSLQSYLLAVVVPDPVVFAELISDVVGKKVTAEDTDVLQRACGDEKITKKVSEVLAIEAKKSGLKGFEAVKRIHVCMDLFSVEEGTLTPTFKLRRRDAYAKFKTRLDELYALGEPSSSRL